MPAAGGMGLAEGGTITIMVKAPIAGKAPGSPWKARATSDGSAPVRPLAAPGGPLAGPQGISSRMAQSLKTLTPRSVPPAFPHRFRRPPGDFPAGPGTGLAPCGADPAETGGDLAGGGRRPGQARRGRGVAPDGPGAGGRRPGAGWRGPPRDRRRLELARGLHHRGSAGPGGDRGGPGGAWRGQARGSRAALASVAARAGSWSWAPR